ncbi:MAG: hypothetical protein RBT47_05285 [Anaerolineae bacterium]|jgi:hypothetical protein|nr:hypothetical protein [Anaerolineae bacterium]
MDEKTDVQKTENQAQANEQNTDVWDLLTELGEEIGKGWQSPLTNTELISEMRR